MSAALLMAWTLTQATATAAPPLQSTPEECAVLHALLAASWPIEEPGVRSILNLDGWGFERPQFFERYPNHPVIADGAFVEEFFPELDGQTAAELSPYFAVGPDYRVDCTFEGLPIRPAGDSLRDLGDDVRAQERLEFPRVSVTQPAISSDGGHAIGGYQWSFVAGRWAEDHCLFERIDGGWRIVDCVLNPLTSAERERLARLPVTQGE